IAGKGVAEAAPNFRPLVRVLRAIVEVGALRAGPEINRNYRDAQHPQAVHNPAADAALIHEHKFRVGTVEHHRNARGKLHGVEALMDLNRAGTGVRPAAGIDDGRVIAEAAYVNADTNAVAGRVGSFAGGRRLRELEGDEGLGIHPGENASNTNANEVGVL